MMGKLKFDKKCIRMNLYMLHLKKNTVIKPLYKRVIHK